MAKSGNKKKKRTTSSTPSQPTVEETDTGTKNSNPNPNLIPKTNSIPSPNPKTNPIPSPNPRTITNPNPNPKASPNPNINAEHLSSVLLRRAHELKDEGNRLFQAKNYEKAIALYDKAIKLTPNHPERAIFHSNKAACLMQMKNPSHYELVVRECTLALQAQPKFQRALFRRARAFEAMGKLELALIDVKTILEEEAGHEEALELGKRLRIALYDQNNQEKVGRKDEKDEEDGDEGLKGRAGIENCVSNANTSSSSNYVVASPASLGASVVGGSCRGPSLPVRPNSMKTKKKKGDKVEESSMPSLKLSPSPSEPKQTVPAPGSAHNDHSSSRMRTNPNPNEHLSSSRTRTNPNEEISSSSSSSSRMRTIPKDEELLSSSQIRTTLKDEELSSSSRVRATANDSACVQTSPNNENAPSSRAQTNPNISMSTTRLDETLKPLPLRPKSLKVVLQKDSSNHLARPLKLIYGHDIRLARLPIKSTFSDLREIVRKRFPSSKAVLIKYKDTDGDLITITCSEELRLAELASFTEADGLKSKVESIESKQRDSDAILVDPMPLLRLHVVEVDPEQEPVIEEEQEQEQEEGEGEEQAQEQEECLDKATPEAIEHDHSLSSLSGKEVTFQASDSIVGRENATDDSKEEENSKEIEIDEWFLDFANLFRTHIGVDPEAHVDLHELGMEFCSEALEQAVTSEEAQPLFEASACKFQEVAALAFFNWGNVHMCAARKRIPLEDNDVDKSVFNERLEAAFEWARTQYEIAREKYEEALRVKPDFYEGVLALGQESFENAKLRWSLAMARQLDLASWDSSETISLFKHAEEKMQLAFEMWEVFEDRKIKEIMVNSSITISETPPKLDPRGKRDGQQKLSESETKEQLRATRFQINLFWGNILFEHSQVEFKLGMKSWKTLLDMAVQKFELAGASPSDIIVVLKNHVANVAYPHDDDVGKGHNTKVQENVLEIQGEHVEER